jgi:hypothetical protein
MIFMDSLNYPHAVLCSESDADGSVAVAKMTMTLNEHAVGLEPTPKTSSRTARKSRDNSGKRIGPATTVWKRSQRSGVMNRKSASRDESPSYRRSPSFDTTSSASCSTISARTAPAPRSHTPGLGTCDVRHPYDLQGPAAAEGGATLSRIWMELRLAQQKG